MDGRQGAELVAMLTLPNMIPVHFDDYDVFASPLADFTCEMQRRGLADRLKSPDLRPLAAGKGPMATQVSLSVTLTLHWLTS